MLFGAVGQATAQPTRGSGLKPEQPTEHQTCQTIIPRRNIIFLNHFISFHSYFSFGQTQGRVLHPEQHLSLIHI